jgi:hypothetical protein
VKWGVAYYRAPDGSIPAADFLDSCPTKVDANFAAVLEAVRAAPPPAFSGGGKWEAMHGTMAGYYEIRGTGPGRLHYRLFCRLENGTADELKTLGLAVVPRQGDGAAPLYDPGPIPRGMRGHVNLGRRRGGHDPVELGGSDRQHGQAATAAPRLHRPPQRSCRFGARRAGARAFAEVPLRRLQLSAFRLARSYLGL